MIWNTNEINVIPLESVCVYWTTLLSPFNWLVLFPVSWNVTGSLDYDLSLLFSCRSYVSLLPVATEGVFLPEEALNRFAIFYWESTKKYPAKENSKNTETNPYFISTTSKPSLRVQWQREHFSSYFLEARLRDTESHLWCHTSQNVAPVMHFVASMPFIPI